MIKKILSIILAIACLLSMTCVFASAAKYRHVCRSSDDFGHNFSQKWRDRHTYTISNIEYDFVYGYDTVLINEDYIEDIVAQKTGTEYYGKVENGWEATQVTNTVKNKAKTGNASVRHREDIAKYYVYAKSLT